MTMIGPLAATDSARRTLASTWGKVIQRVLGHKSAKVTLDTYAALFPDDLDNVAEALSRQRAQRLSY